MALVLKVENQTSLPDGSSLSVSIQGKRGIDIGRDQYLDWTLPDPSRVISGRHCEIRWRDDAYWLHDTSTNGTFLVGAETRLPVPYRIRNGDRFVIGHYIICAIIDGEAADTGRAAAADSNLSYDEIWNAVGEVAPPINPKQLKPRRDLRPMKADFLEWAMDVPYTPAASPQPSFPEPPPKAPLDDMSWAQSTEKVLPPVADPHRPAEEPERPSGRPPRPTAKPAGPADAAVSSAHVMPAGSAQSVPETSMGELVRLFSRGAGLPEDALAGCDPAGLAEEVGQLLRVLSENTKRLLEGRQQAKRLVRSSDHTIIQAVNNNPLKFAPTAEEAMRVMFGPPNLSYLDAHAAFSQGFDNLKSHQVRTYSAMQHALKALLEEFDPVEIEKNASNGRSLLADIFGFRKARLWDTYVSQWKTRTTSKKDAVLGAFMDYFAEHYDLEEFGREK